MKQVVVNQVPAPALVITAQQGHVSLALHGRPFRSNAYHGNGAKRAFPPDLPGVPPLRKADFATCPICALGNGVAVQGETILLHVNIAGAVVGAQSMLKSLELQRKTGEGSAGSQNHRYTYFYSFSAKYRFVHKPGKRWSCTLSFTLCRTECIAPIRALELKAFVKSFTVGVISR